MSSRLPFASTSSAATVHLAMPEENKSHAMFHDHFGSCVRCRYPLVASCSVRPNGKERNAPKLTILARGEDGAGLG